MEIRYTTQSDLNVEQVIALYKNCSLGQRRPVDEPEKFAQMIQHANLIVTAWQGEQLVGLARAFTDFVHVTYLADLVVDERCQRQGIGRALIQLIKTKTEPSCRIVLLAAPSAKEYYAKLGFDFDPRAWVLDGDKPLI